MAVMVRLFLAAVLITLLAATTPAASASADPTPIDARPVAAATACSIGYAGTWLCHPGRLLGHPRPGVAALPGVLPAPTRRRRLRPLGACRCRRAQPVGDRLPVRDERRVRRHLRPPRPPPVRPAGVHQRVVPRPRSDGLGLLDPPARHRPAHPVGSDGELRRAEGVPAAHRHLPLDLPGRVGPGGGVRGSPPRTAGERDDRGQRLPPVRCAPPGRVLPRCRGRPLTPGVRDGCRSLLGGVDQRQLARRFPKGRTQPLGARTRRGRRATGEGLGRPDRPGGVRSPLRPRADVGGGGVAG